MQLGTTIGPNLDFVEGETGDVEFVEPALNARDCPVESFDATDFRSKLDDAGLDCTVHLPHFPPLATAVPEVDAGMREYQERAVAKAATLDAEVGVVHGTVGIHDERHREAFAEQAAWLAETCRDRGIDLAVENMGYKADGFALDEVAAIAREADAGICFDVGHAYREGGQAAVGTGTVDFEPMMTWAAGRDVTVAVELLVDDYAFQRDSVRRLRAITPT
jgi:sugar phosphate isomerase/epimerase